MVHFCKFVNGIFISVLYIVVLNIFRCTTNIQFVNIKCQRDKQKDRGVNGEAMWKRKCESGRYENEK